MSSRATNPIDFAKAIGCFCIVWYHSQYYWSLNSGARQDVDLAKFYTISWAMPFFYISAFYFIARYGIRKESPGKVLQKMGRVFYVQLLVIMIYGIYRFSVNLFLKEFSFQTLIDQFFNDLSLRNSLLVFSSGNSTPAYFLAQLFYLYLPLYLLGRFFAISRYFAVIAIGLLLVAYFLDIQNSFITKEFYFYLAVSIALLMLNSMKIRGNPLYKALFCISILIISIWRMNHDEFLLFGLAVWGAFSLLCRGNVTNSLATRISRFGDSYSLFVFLFHLLALEIIEALLSRLSINLVTSDSQQVTTYALINILAFGSSVIAAVFLNRRIGLRLKL